MPNDIFEDGMGRKEFVQMFGIFAFGSHSIIFLFYFEGLNLMQEKNALLVYRPKIFKFCLIN